MTDAFLFRGLHPQVAMGTATDRYAGWIGQIYTPGRWEGRITRREHRVGGRAFTEEVLPVESVEEYFQHFGVLELDATFYRPLLDAELHPTETFHLLRAYAAHLKEGDRLILKAPQVVVAPRILREGRFGANPDYLDADLFTRRFHAPAVRLLEGRLAGILLEQEYVRARDRDRPERVAADLERFLAAIPGVGRCHLELRTEAYLSEPVLGVLDRAGVGLVLSHWTWLPSLARQLARSGDRFHDTGGEVLIRLLTPRGMRYEESYARAHPFRRLVEGMASPRMLEEAADLMRRAVAEGRRVTVIVNNRAGGNAPLVARELAARFLGEEVR
jgi:uncharacterized protein YecE (DUF72 family)